MGCRHSANIAGGMEQQDRVKEIFSLPQCLYIFPCFYVIGFGLSFQEATTSLHNVVYNFVKDSWDGKGKRKL